MKKKNNLFLWLILIILIIIIIIQANSDNLNFDGVNEQKEIINNFEEFVFSENIGDKLYFKGEAQISTQWAEGEKLYRLRDLDGFEIFFTSRGGRYIEAGKTYVIYGLVSNEEHCGVFGCENKYYIKELKGD